MGWSPRQDVSLYRYVDMYVGDVLRAINGLGWSPHEVYSTDFFRTTVPIVMY